MDIQRTSAFAGSEAINLLLKDTWQKIDKLFILGVKIAENSVKPWVLFIKIVFWTGLKYSLEKFTISRDILSDFKGFTTPLQMHPTSSSSPEFNSSGRCTFIESVLYSTNKMKISNFNNGYFYCAKPLLFKAIE